MYIDSSGNDPCDLSQILLFSFPIKVNIVYVNQYYISTSTFGFENQIGFSYSICTAFIL